MRKTGSKVTALAIVLVLAFITACAPTPNEVIPATTPPPKETTPTPTPVPTPTAEWGVIEVRVTDALAKDISKIMVTAKNIEVHKALAEQEREQKQQQSGSGNQTQEQEREQEQQGEGEWITIVTNPEPFDLVELSKGGLEKLLGEKQLPAGKYTQIRMDVISVVVTIKGEDKPATVPSDKLKVVRPFDVEANSITTLTLDFDADKSTVVTGKGDVQFKPVVKLLTKKGAKPESVPSTNMMPESPKP